jgi:hypothetical protein
MRLGTQTNSASRTASNKMHHNKTVLQSFNSLYRDTQMPSRIPSADAQIKNWLSRHCHLLSFSIWTIYLLYKNYTATLKAGQFFMPTLMPCKCSLTRRFHQDDIAICKVAHFANGHLFNFLQLDSFCAIIKLPHLLRFV